MSNHGGKRAGAGRKPGSRNRKSLEAMRRLRGTDADPITALLRIATKAEKASDDALAFQCYKELASYCYPKLKAIEHSGSDGGALTIQVVKLADTSPDE